MAISEQTKIIAQSAKSTIDTRIKDINADIAEHQAAIDRLKAAKLLFKSERDALEADIPAPTPIVIEP